jgi:hypothetical protein
VNGVSFVLSRYSFGGKKKKGKVAQVFREFFFIELKGQANLSEIEALSKRQVNLERRGHCRLTPTHTFNPNPSRPLSSSTNPIYPQTNQHTLGVPSVWTKQRLGLGVFRSKLNALFDTLPVHNKAVGF